MHCFLVLVLGLFVLTLCGTEVGAGNPSYHRGNPPERVVLSANAVVLAVAVPSEVGDQIFPGSPCSELRIEFDYIVCSEYLDDGTGALVSFDVVEVLKGWSPSRFLMPNGRLLTPQFALDNPRFSETYDNHTDPAYWKYDGGRSMLISRRVSPGYFPAFVEGQTYLLMPDYFSYRSYEAVVSPDDEWLRFVRGVIAIPGPIADSSDQELIVERVFEALAGQEQLYLARLISCQEPSTFEIIETFVGERRTEISYPYLPTQLCREFSETDMSREFLYWTTSETSYRANLPPRERIGHHLLFLSDDGQFSYRTYGEGSRPLTWEYADLSVGSLEDVQRPFSIERVRAFFASQPPE